MPAQNDRAPARARADHARKVKLEQFEALPQITASAERGRRLLPKAEVLERVGVSYPTLWKMMRANQFPRGVFVGAKLGWFEHEVDAFLDGAARQKFGSDDESEVA
jgi:predicted DNA-binding transcriptional regulator AlpA